MLCAISFLRLKFNLLKNKKIILFLDRLSEPFYDAPQIVRLHEFITSCRQKMNHSSNLLWIALQSNLLVDLCEVGDKHGWGKNFEPAIHAMKRELTMNGWILPTLRANMRNQVNICNIQVSTAYESTFEILSTIESSKSGSTMVGEIPTLFMVDNWVSKKHDVLQYCIKMITSKSEKNIVVLFDHSFGRNGRTLDEDHADVIRRATKDKNVVTYPSIVSETKSICVIKDFIEKDNQILVTEDHYFNGCESPNVIYLYSGGRGKAGLRNCLLRGVQNLICIQDWNGYQDANIEGMKIDTRFRESRYR